MKRQHEANIARDLPAARQAELGDLESLLARLAADVAPEPRPDETARLLDHLRPLVAARAATLPEWSQPRQGLATWLALARAQAWLADATFWWACAGVLLLGLLAGLLGTAGTLALTVVCLSPALAAAGVAYVFRPATRTIWEWERCCPVRPLELLYVRLGLIVASNIAVAGLILSVVSAETPGLLLWRLILAWLGPLLGLAGLALYISVRWGSLAGVAAPLTIWAALIVLGWQALVERAPLARLRPSEVLLPLLGSSDGLLLTSGAALIAGVLLLCQGGRLALGERQAWS